MLSDKDERQVWVRFLDGDDLSLLYFYNKYVHVLFSYGHQFCSNADLIKDCIQNLFCDLLIRRKKLSKANSVKAYLLASLKRMVLKELKSEKKYQLIEDEAFVFIPDERTISLTFDAHNINPSDVRSKINLLPAKQREVIYLYFYEGLSYAEIADVMKIKVRSARILTYRALDRLQKSFQS